MGKARIVLQGILAAATFLVVAGAGAVDARAAKRVALVVGNGDYAKLTALANPSGDAARMAELLARNGFEVLSCDGERPGCFDLDRGGMLDALDEFRELADGAEVALAFYAGHGMQTGEGNVLAPTDIEIDCAEWRAKRSVLLDDVLAAMEGAGEKIVILDACRNDPFKAQQCLGRGVRPLSFGSFAVPQGVDRFLLMSSTQNGQMAQDGLPGTHSPFAASLFRFMEEDRTVAFGELFDRVSKNVIETTAAMNFTQIPEVLIRGGAPEACLAGAGCGADRDAQALRAELQELRSEYARNQDYERIVVALLESGGLDPKTIGAEEKERFFATVMAATRSLAQKGEAGGAALAALAQGDAGKAEQVFHRDLALLRQNPSADRSEIARSAADLAALAWAKGDPDKAEHLYRQALTYDPRNLAAWIHLAELRLAMGRNDEARAAYQEGRVVAAAGAGEPADRVWVLEGLADTWWSMDPQRAAALYRQANALAAQLLVEHPGDTGLRRGLIVTHYNIGHLAMDEGDTTRALKEFEAGLTLAEALAEEHPTDLRWQYDVGRGHERIGRALLAAGEEAAATQAFLRKQAIAERIARSGDATYVQDAALADEFLADLALRQKDYASAELRYQSSLERMRPLSAAAPGNPGFKRWMSVTLLELGDVRVESGRPDAAWANYQEAAAISEALVAARPASGQWRWDLFRAYQRLASTRPPGTEYHAKALATIEAMKAAGLLGPGNEKWIAITRQRLEEARQAERQAD